MASYRAIMNPHTGNLTLIRSDSAFHLKDSVDTYNSLPVSSNTENDVRITQDTDKMYTWGIASSSGILADWKEIGDVSSVDWSAINNKPNSAVVDIDDAVDKKHTQNTDTDLEATFEATFVKKLDTVNVLSDISSTGANIEDAVTKKHTQNTDQKLDDGGANEVVVADVKSAVDLKHTQGTDAKLDEGGGNETSAIELRTALDTTIPGKIDDILDSDTKLLLHLNGADEATSSIDSSPSEHVLTFTGSAKLDDAEKKFGVTSVNFGGPSSPGKISASNSSDFLFGSEDFTVDLWIQTGTIPINSWWFPIGMWHADSSERSWQILIITDGAGVVSLHTYYSTDGSSNVSIIETITWPVDVMNHIALERYNNKLYLYLNGVIQNVGGLDVTGATFFNSTGDLEIGRRGSSNEAILGWQDEIRISKVGRYQGTNFTPATLPYGTLNHIPIIIAGGELAQSNVHINDIYDTISKAHTQDTDQKLDEGGGSEVSATEAKAGYDHSVVSSGNPHSVTKSEVGLTDVPDVDTTPVNIQFVIDGGGSAIATGLKGYIEIPFACTIERVTMLLDQSATTTVDIWKDTYANFPPTDADSITASAVPGTSATDKDQDATLTGWTKSVSAGDILAFNVDANDNAKTITISLKAVKV